MKVPVNYKGKVILQFSTTEYGLINEGDINLFNDQSNEIVYVEAKDDIIEVSDCNSKFISKYIYYYQYDCYTSITYEKINSICKIINLIS